MFRHQIGRESCGATWIWSNKFGLKDADPNTDVLNWDFKTYEPKRADVIWVLPPCTEYSTAMARQTWNMKSTNQVGLETVEVV